VIDQLDIEQPTVRNDATCRLYVEFAGPGVPRRVVVRQQQSAAVQSHRLAEQGSWMDHDARFCAGSERILADEPSILVEIDSDQTLVGQTGETGYEPIQQFLIITRQWSPFDPFAHPQLENPARHEEGQGEVAVVSQHVRQRLW
jgi:hypothetical protein